MYQLEGKGNLQPRRNAAAGPLHIQPSVQKDIDSCKIPPCLTEKFLVSGHFRDLKQALKNSFRHSRVYFSIQKAHGLLAQSSTTFIAARSTHKAFLVSSTRDSSAVLPPPPRGYRTAAYCSVWGVSPAHSSENRRGCTSVKAPQGVCLRQMVPWPLAGGMARTVNVQRTA